jgi:peptidylprolyl isomerase
MKKLLISCWVFLMGCCGLQAEIATMHPKQSHVVIETNLGNIEITLFNDLAPKACENFLGLAQKSYYNGTTFHRVIPQFMLQGGDPQGNGTGGESVWGKKFEDEFSSSLTFNRPGLLAMANSGPNTNGSQFFITTVATPWLNRKHTIFGEVTKGYDVVKAIESKGSQSGACKEKITILKVSVK